MYERVAQFVFLVHSSTKMDIQNIYIYIYIYIIFISVNSLNNIMNMSLFMQVEIARHLLLFDEATYNSSLYITIYIYIYILGSITLHLKVIFYSSHCKYIIDSVYFYLKIFFD